MDGPWAEVGAAMCARTAFALGASAASTARSDLIRSTARGLPAGHPPR